MLSFLELNFDISAQLDFNFDASCVRCSFSNSESFFLTVLKMFQLNDKTKICVNISNCDLFVQSISLVEFLFDQMQT